MIATREIFLITNLQTASVGAIELIASYGERIDFVNLSSIFPTLDIKYESTQEIAKAQMKRLSFPIMGPFKYDWNKAVVNICLEFAWYQTEISTGIKLWMKICLLNVRIVCWKTALVTCLRVRFLPSRLPLIDTDGNRLNTMRD